MITTQEKHDLLATLATATAGSNELDKLIHIAIGGPSSGPVPPYTTDLRHSVSLFPPDFGGVVYLYPRQIDGVRWGKAEVNEPVRYTDDKGNRITEWKTYQCGSLHEGTVVPRPVELSACIAGLKAHWRIM